MRKNLFRNQNVILILALILGLAVGGGAAALKPLVLPLLALVMTLSSMGVGGDLFRSPKAMVKPVLAGILMNFLVLGGSLLGLSHFLISDPEIKAGFILLAVVPPAVAVIPFSVMLNGNLNFTLLATIGAYLSSLVLTPGLALILLGGSFIQPLKLLTILFQLILIPLIGSRFLLRAPFADTLNRYRGDIINWSFFLVIYTLVGLNRDVFFSHPLQILPIAAISIMTTFGLGWLIDQVSLRLGVEAQLRVSLALLGTLKNYGSAAALGLVIYDREAALPATVATIAMILYAVWLGRHPNL